MCVVPEASRFPTTVAGVFASAEKFEPATPGTYATTGAVILKDAFVPGNPIDAFRQLMTREGVERKETWLCKGQHRSRVLRVFRALGLIRSLRCILGLIARLWHRHIRRLQRAFDLPVRAVFAVIFVNRSFDGRSFAARHANHVREGSLCAAKALRSSFAVNLVVDGVRAACLVVQLLTNLLAHRIFHHEGRVFGGQCLPHFASGKRLRKNRRLERGSHARGHRHRLQVLLGDEVVERRRVLALVRVVERQRSANLLTLVG